ncbi:MAG: hypothetical protein ABIH41_00240 [Nanoarchaeota archaeon]
MADVRITYETLFDLLRREKSREELQVLDPSFYVDVMQYVREKTGVISKDSSQGVFVNKEAEKVRIQLQNVHKILRELYERRQAKIVKMAQDRVKTEESLMDLSMLLPQERLFFDECVSLLGRFKQAILTNVLAGHLPQVSQVYQAQEVERRAEGEDALDSDDGDAQDESESGVRVSAAVSDPSSDDDAPQDQPADSPPELRRRVKFLHPVPRFLGRQMETYGPFAQDDVAELPDIIANILVKKGRAEEVEGSN